MAKLSGTFSRVAAAAVVLLGLGGIAYWKMRGPAVAPGVATLTVPPGFTVEKVAGPELISYPMMGTFDERGRLFIAESSGNTLNNDQMAANPDYQIRLLEDRDGDGKFDHSQVFASKLTLPAGAVWHQNALYVAAPPDLLRFEDADGDGVAEKREVIVTGWKMSSNAASLHGPILGPDGWLYLTDGRHGFHIKTKDGREYDGLGSRIWRVRPDGTGLEWIAGGGFDNPVEVTFTPDGEVIGTMTYFKDPENGERDALLHYVEGGVYPKWYSVVDEFKRTGELMPVMTKFARIAPSGVIRYEAGAWGPEYTGNLYTAQFNPHRVQRHVVHREGATFRTEDSEFLTSSDPDFHPTDVIEDADGSLIVFDTGAWFIHGCPISRVAKPEIKGGIYRIRKTGAGPVADPRGLKIDWAKSDPAQLAALLDDRRPAVRQRAIEEVVRLGGSAAPAVVAARRGSKSEEARMAAVFALYRMGSRDGVREALEDASARVRSAALRCVGMEKDRAAFERTVALLGDKDPGLRRRAAATLGQMDDGRAVPALLEAARNPEDRFVEHSIIHSLILLNQPAPVAAALAAGEPKVKKAALIALDQMDGSTLTKDQVATLLNGNDAMLRSAALWVVAHHADWGGVVLQYVGNRLRRPALEAEELAGIREALLTFGKDAGVQGLVAKLLGEKLSEDHLLFLLEAVEETRGKELPAAWVGPLGRLIDTGAPAVQARAVDLVRARAIASFDGQMRRIAGDEKAPEALRASAMGVLVARTPQLPEEQWKFLTARLGDGTEAVLRQSAARVVGRSTPSREQMLELAGRLEKADPLVLATVLDAFRGASDPAVGAVLAEVLRKSPGALGTLGEARLTALFAKFPEATRQAAAPLFAELKKAETERAQRLEKLEPLLTAGGDVGRGRRVFFGEKAACASCHAIRKEGKKVGPDLTGIGSIRSGHDLLEAIVFPSASFVPGHEIYNVDTASERFSGVLKVNSPTVVVLVTGPDGEVRIPRSQVKKLEPSTVSIMPEGFDQSLTTEELTDLLAFLQNERAR